jgi:hypothetical protein
MKLNGIIVAGLFLAACGQSQSNQVENGSLLIPNEANPHVPPPPAPHPPAPPAAPKPAIDPKSKEAASAIVRGFVDALNAGRVGDAWMLLGPGAEPRAAFERRIARYSGLKVNAGVPGDEEGAAGSIYLSVPLTISGTVSGKRVSDSATAILRRVNDVPGSTEEQRHWHIERIDWDG